MAGFLPELWQIFPPAVVKDGGHHVNFHEVENP